MEAEKSTENSDKQEIQSQSAGDEIGENSIREQLGEGNEEPSQSCEESIGIGIGSEVGEKPDIVEKTGGKEIETIVEESVNRNGDNVAAVPENIEGKEEFKEDVKEDGKAKEGSGAQSGVQDENGGKGRGCFGVRSYLHHFYDAEKSPKVYDDYVEEDDFEFLVDPGKRRDRWCCWFRWCTWSGANLILIGIITLLVGYLTPKRDVVVGFHDHLEILDRWAITFNQRLEFCRIAGLAIFCLGGFVVLIALIISAFGSHSERRRCERSFTYITTTIVEPYKDDGSLIRKIPITEEIKPIQPAGLGPVGKNKAVVVQMPYY